MNPSSSETNAQELLLTKKPLLQTIKTYIDSVDHDEVLSPKERSILTSYFTELVARQLLKYISGKQKHGGEFFEDPIDALRELQMEIDDAGFYLERLRYGISQLNKTKKKRTNKKI